MADMQIDQKNLSKLFSDMQKRTFVIPEYQRPYNWDEDKCQILWDDLKDNFFANPGVDYFLGTIVTCKNGVNLEVIDGQQRLTTFSLLLRAFYTKLESMPESDEVSGLKRQIEPCLWDTDDISQKVTDKSKIRVVSEVATEQDKTSFRFIMETGYVGNRNNRYASNYIFFQEQCDKFAKDAPMEWYKFCNYILRRCVLLPIECQNQEVALTIFSTLNNRGLPLYDADIFKSELYKASNDKELFIKQWNELSELCESTKDKNGNYEFTIDDMFMYYMQVLRGRAEDKDSTNIGLRNFYLNDKKKRLLEPNLITELLELAEFWKSANGYDGKYKIDDESMKWFHCLWTFPNTIWVYPVSAYILTAKTTENMGVFLKKLCAYVYAKYIYSPSLSGIKGAVYALDVEICKGNYLGQMTGDFINENIEYELDKFAYMQTKKFIRGILTIDAYLNPNQVNLLQNPEKLEIEHILPKQWQNANYNGWTREEAETCIEKFGNKVLFEKKLNIQAGDGYFGQKKKKYERSNVEAVKDLSRLETNNWSKEELLQRDKELKDRVIGFFKLQLN